jgi:hypothetical protein
MNPIAINDLNLLKFCHEKVGGYGKPIGDEFPDNCVVLGQYRNDKEPLWVMVLHEFKEDHDCMMDLTLNHKGMLTPSLFRMMGRVVFDYIFKQANLVRCSSQVRASHKASIKITKAWGMREEGIKRLGFKYPKPEDMYLFGMLKTECPWI